MSFIFVTIACAHCHKSLGAHTILARSDMEFYCPSCVAVIEEVRYSLGIIDIQTYAHALMALHFHNNTPNAMIDNNHGLRVRIKLQSWAYWHVKMAAAVKTLCEKIRV